MNMSRFTWQATSVAAVERLVHRDTQQVLCVVSVDPDSCEQPSIWSYVRSSNRSRSSPYTSKEAAKIAAVLEYEGNLVWKAPL